MPAHRPTKKRTFVCSFWVVVVVVVVTTKVVGNSQANAPCFCSVLPAIHPDLLASINKFQLEGFAKLYFETHKKGPFRRKVPLVEMLVWTKVRAVCACIGGSPWRDLTTTSSCTVRL